MAIEACPLLTRAGKSVGPVATATAPDARHSAEYGVGPPLWSRNASDVSVPHPTEWREGAAPALSRHSSFALRLRALLPGSDRVSKFLPHGRRNLNHLLLAALAVPWLLGTTAIPLLAKKKEPQKQGVIAGTVFKESGFSLAGATLTLKPVVEEGVKIKKKEIQQTTSDRRGEFSFRVPFGSLGYTVRVEADGWQPAERTVQSQWDQRININFRLKPAAAPEATND